MKLDRTRWFVITGVIMAVTIAGLSLVYFQRSQQQKQLDARLIQAQSETASTEILNLITTRNEKELASTRASSQLDALRFSNSRQVVSSTITRTLFDVAKAHGMEISELVSSAPTDATFKGVSFSLINLKVIASGDGPKMIDFLIHLNSSFSSGVIQSVIINIPEKTDAGKATADISMDIYTN